MAALTDADRSRLREMIERDWVEAALSGDWDASMALCTDDFAYLPQDHPLLNGKEEAKAFLGGFPSIVKFSQSLDTATGSTDLAALRGSFHLHVLMSLRVSTGLPWPRSWQEMASAADGRGMA